MAEKQRIPDALRRQTRERAHGCCEYCLIHEDDVMLSHEADHVIAEKHGGQTTLANLAWACAPCNRYKGTDLTSIDPATGKVVQLFNPRTQRWRRHFELNGGRIEALTASGRTTIQLLHLNDQERILERLALIGANRYPIIPS